jgi:uncharacterized membrane protein
LLFGKGQVLNPLLHKRLAMQMKYALLFSILAIFFITILQVDLFEIAFTKLGLTPQQSLFLLIGSLLGSGINLPLLQLRNPEQGFPVKVVVQKVIFGVAPKTLSDKVIIAVNVGGCLIPVGLSLYFISLQLIDPVKIFIGVFGITLLSYKTSQLIPGFGVGMPIFLAPLSSALLALIIDPEHAAQLAYMSGVLGVLIGADLMRIKNIAQLGRSIAVIGGAGTFDGIFLTGLIAALLA